MSSFLKEFKAFAMRGNVLDMAVGIIIGAEFGKIVASAVGDLLMPPLGVLMGGVDFADKHFEIRAAVLDAVGKVTSPAVEIRYGVFINHVINFVIVAFAVFMMIKAMNAAKKKQDAAPASPASPPKQELLLEEIRDLLKKGR